MCKSLKTNLLCVFAFMLAQGILMAQGYPIALILTPDGYISNPNVQPGGLLTSMDTYKRISAQYFI